MKNRSQEVNNHTIWKTNRLTFEKVVKAETKVAVHVLLCKC